MLHIEYSDTDYKGTCIDFQPANSSEIPGLRDMINHNLIVENPARTFTHLMKNGWYDGWSDDEIAAHAEKANILADLWDEESSMNALMLLSRALQMILCKELTQHQP